MIHRLTNVRSDLEGYQALARLAVATAKLDYSSLELSFASVSWFDANMSVPLGVVLAAARDRYNTVSIVDISWSQQSILRRNGFLSNFGHPLPRTLGDTIIPYARFKSSEASRFHDYLEEHLPGKGIPEMTDEFSLRFQQSLGEIFINTQTHAKSELGVFVCGQFFPAKQRLDITMADGGVTIPGKVAQRFNVEVPPIVALRWALVEGHTTKQGTPGGFGLKLLRQFVAQNRGKLQIASGKAFWDFRSGKEQFSELNEAFPGTIVTLEINTTDTRLYDTV